MLNLYSAGNPVYCFYIFLYIFRFAGQMHAELFEDALIYRGKQDGGMNLTSF